MNAQPSPKLATRRWLQWSLRSFLIAMVALAAVFTWWGAKLRCEARLNEAVRLVAASPVWFLKDDYDPMALVRAVNALHALGRKDAIEALRRFAKEYPPRKLTDRHEALCLIIPLLFDRADPEDKFPSTFGVDEPGNYALVENMWPDDFSGFINVADDIPFHQGLHSGSFVGGIRDHSYAINWAAKTGRLRTSPLTRTDSIFNAADNAAINVLFRFDGRKMPVAFDVLVKRHVRGQVLPAVSHLLPPDEAAKYRWKENLSPDQWLDLANDDHWTQLKTECSPIRWSGKSQAYVHVAN